MKTEKLLPLEVYPYTLRYLQQLVNVAQYLEQLYDIFNETSGNFQKTGVKTTKLFHEFLTDKREENNVPFFSNFAYL